MVVLTAYVLAKGSFTAFAVYCSYDSIMVATSDSAEDIGRQGFTWRFSGLVWGVWIAWGQLEGVILKALSVAIG